MSDFVRNLLSSLWGRGRKSVSEELEFIRSELGQNSERLRRSRDECERILGQLRAKQAEYEAAEPALKRHFDEDRRHLLRQFEVEQRKLAEISRKREQLEEARGIRESQLNAGKSVLSPEYLDEIAVEREEHFENQASEDQAFKDLRKVEEKGRSSLLDPTRESIDGRVSDLIGSEDAESRRSEIDAQIERLLGKGQDNPPERQTETQ